MTGTLRSIAQTSRRTAGARASGSPAVRTTTASYRVEEGFTVSPRFRGDVGQSMQRSFRRQQIVTRDPVWAVRRFDRGPTHRRVLLSGAWSGLLTFHRWFYLLRRDGTVRWIGLHVLHLQAEQRALHGALSLRGRGPGHFGEGL